MGDQRTDLPSPKSPNFEQRLRETVMTYLGRQGSKFDRGITVRDLIDMGLARFKNGSTQLEIGDGIPGGGTQPGGGGGPVDPPYEPDLTPPPTPTGFKLAAGIDFVFVTVDPATYSVGHGHLRTRVYAKQYTSGALPVFGDAVEVGQFEGTVWVFASPPQTTWHVWVKWESKDGVLSVDPAGGTNGLSITTGYDVELLLAALTGQITESQLYTDLGARIDLIDGNAAGSVNARIAEEAQAREDNDGNLYAQYTVKVDLAGHVSGFGLASEAAQNETPRSQFGVRADRFWVAPPAINSPTAPTVDRYDGMVWNDTSQSPTVTKYWNAELSRWDTTPTANLPFIIQVSPTTINGQAVPAGVYMDTAFIKNGTITSVMIGNAQITTAHVVELSADKISSGAIDVSRTIQSAIFTDTPGSYQGWKILGNGQAIFNQVTVRGDVYASNGSFTGTVWATDGQFKGTILGGNASAYTTGTGFFSGLYLSSYRWRVGNPAGARIEWNGASIGIYDSSNNLIFGAGGSIPWTSITGVPGGIYNSEVYLSGGRLYGIGTGNSELVQNSYISVNASGQITGIGTGNNTTVANDRISVSGGVISGIGTGNNTPVANSAITIDANGTLVGAGTAGVVVQNNKITIDGAGFIQGIGTVGATAKISNSVITLNESSGAITLANAGGGTFTTITANNKLWATYDANGNVIAGNISTFMNNAAIGTALINDATISTAKIRDLAVAEAKIADLAVGSAKIQNAAVGTLKVAGQAITAVAAAYSPGPSTAYCDLYVPSEAWDSVTGFQPILFNVGIAGTQIGPNPASCRCRVWIRSPSPYRYENKLTFDIFSGVVYAASGDYGSTTWGLMPASLAWVHTPDQVGWWTVYVQWENLTINWVDLPPHVITMQLGKR